MSNRPNLNLIFIIIDSLRADHVGINGNPWIKTPNLDKFGAQSVRFTGAYPESLPTMPVRRAMSTGRRVFPFDNWRYWKPVPVPGWQPIGEGEMTLAETLRDSGYTTAMFTDCFHLFRPGGNFHRGFDQWDFIRGNSFDPFRSGAKYPDKCDYRDYFPKDIEKGSGQVFGGISYYELNRYLRNVEMMNGEEESLQAQVFRRGMKWLDENHDAENFFLLLDSFKPHEPWLPPRWASRMYEDEEYTGIEIIRPEYTTDCASLGYTPEMLKHTQALYAGEVTLLDRWLGFFLDKLDYMGLSQNTVVAIMSDHGVGIGHNGIIGKPVSAHYPEMMDLVMMVKSPGLKPAVIDSLIYNIDLFPTFFNLMGLPLPWESDGLDLMPVIKGEKDGLRDYLTCSWKESNSVRTSQYQFMCSRDESSCKLFDLAQDPDCQNDISADTPALVKEMIGLLRKDAGGEMKALDPQGVPANLKNMNIQL